MKKFIVSWEIEIEAEDVIEAAKLARESFLDDVNPSFVVMDSDTEEDFFVEPEPDPELDINLAKDKKLNKFLLN